MNLRKVSVVLLALLLAAMAMVPMVSAATGPADQNIIGKNIPAPNALIVNSNSPPPQEQNDGVVIDNPEEYLKNWNDKMHWGLTQQQIMDDAKKLETTVLPKYRDESDKKNFEIKNLTRFSQEMGESIGLSKEQVSAYVSAHKKQLVIDHQNYLKPHDSTRISTLSTNAINAVSPGSQSAPDAWGKVYYLYIFTNFQTPGSDGAWTTAHINDAQTDAATGTNAIRSQADSRAGMVNNGGYYTVTVSGQDTGDNSQSWGTSGWMEQAVRNLGYTDTNGDGRTTDDLARSIKSWSGSNSVMLMFLTHDAMGGYAVGPDQGYADKLALSYWGTGSSGRFDSVPGSYEHEALHLYGALDEYSGSSYCGQTSILAVDPMDYLYSNTNHITCSGSTNSVMRDPYSTSTISQSSRKFIGWGDHDSDGILDPVDSTP